MGAAQEVFSYLQLQTPPPAITAVTATTAATAAQAPSAGCVKEGEASARERKEGSASAGERKEGSALASPSAGAISIENTFSVTEISPHDRYYRAKPCKEAIEYNVMIIYIRTYRIPLAYTGINILQHPR